MRLTPALPLLLLAWPIAEIAALVWVGSHLGVVNTVGLALLRYEGFGLMRRVQAELAAGRMPAGTLLDGFIVLLAAFLLILPGFLSDLLAFLLLFAPVRRLIIATIASRMTVTTMSTGRRRTEDGVVDLDEDEWSRDGGNSDSPWSGGPRSLPPEPPSDGRGDRS
jgi:UPF0716 protein FxsA